jgi:hypothetical protein
MARKSIVRRSRGPKTTPNIDWRRFDAITDNEIAAAVATDPDAAPLIRGDWIKKAKLIAPTRRGQAR